MELTFTIELHNEKGKMPITMFNVPTVEKAIYGSYCNGVPYQPDDEVIQRLLPYRYVSAFKRSAVWWVEMNPANERLFRTLRCSKGSFMVELLAKPDWIKRVNI